MLECGWSFVSELQQGDTGFSVSCTFLHALHTGLKLKRVFKESCICVKLSVGMGEMNAQICARNNSQYIRVLKYTYMRVSQITLYMPARKAPFDRMTFRIRYSNENYFNKKSSI